MGQYQLPSMDSVMYRPLLFRQRPAAQEIRARYRPSMVPNRVLGGQNVSNYGQDVRPVPAKRSFHDVNPFGEQPHTRMLDPNVIPWQPSRVYETNTAVPSSAAKVDMIDVLRQISNTPKLEFLHFDGDPMKYGAFIHNFENFLERDNPDNSRRLQLLIQHCSGNARESIESCVSLSNESGYRVAKETLYENFGKPHVIAEAHTKKLLNLPNLKSGDGPSLLQFVRNLEIAQRTLTGMGSSYVADLDHMHVLRELAKKLPMYVRSRWTEYAGNLFESGQRPRFEHFLKFIKQRAKLVNNEFGRDMSISYSRVKTSGKEPGGEAGKTNEKLQSFPVNDREHQQKFISPRQRPVCEVCSGQHRIWNCERFKKCDYKTKRKVVLSNGLCNKCLDKGHIARSCPKTYFKCRKLGCGPGSSVATTYSGESRICLGAVPVRVRGRKGIQEVQIYALLDSGSEVTLCDERLAKKLDLKGKELNITLTGINGSVEMESQLVDIIVTSLDGTTEVELQNVKTVKQIPISNGCVPRQVDVDRWPHLRDVCVPELEDGTIMLLIGLKEKPRLFLPLESNEGSEGEPIAIRYSLGLTVMGPVGDERADNGFSVNFTRAKDRDPVVLYSHGPSKPIEGEEMSRIEMPSCQIYKDVQDHNLSNEDVLAHQFVAH